MLPYPAAWRLLFGAWLLAAVSTLGSLFLGEVMGHTPCSLCWYQRIFMFPLALLLPIGLFPLDRKAALYGLPLAVLGALFAGYHVLLTAGVVPKTLAPCARGVSCSDDPIVWFGFVNIPLLSLAAFTGIVVLLALAASRSSSEA